MKVKGIPWRLKAHFLVVLYGRYLGENPEWEFIPDNESCVLPFQEYREKLSKQRVRRWREWAFPSSSDRRSPFLGPLVSFVPCRVMPCDAASETSLCSSEVRSCSETVYPLTLS